MIEMKTTLSVDISGIRMVMAMSHIFKLAVQVLILMESALESPAFSPLFLRRPATQFQSQSQ